jgi:hypothetical protein
MLHLRERWRISATAAAMVSVCLFTTAQAQAPKGEEKTDKMRHRLEQIFVWRVADRLGLSTQEESRFNEEFTKLSHEKSELSRKLEVCLAKLVQDKGNNKAVAKHLDEYRDTLKKYNMLQSREMEVLSRIFKPEKMVEYVLLKQEMTQKFKDVLVQGSRPGTEKASLKEPEVIQEK